MLPRIAILAHMIWVLKQEWGLKSGRRSLEVAGVAGSSTWMLRAGNGRRRVNQEQGSNGSGVVADSCFQTPWQLKSFWREHANRLGISMDPLSDTSVRVPSL